MKTSRRTFLKSAGTLTAGVVISPSIISCNKSKNEDVKFLNTLKDVYKRQVKYAVGDIITKLVREMCIRDRVLRQSSQHHLSRN